MLHFLINAVDVRLGEEAGAHGVNLLLSAEGGTTEILVMIDDGLETDFHVVENIAGFGLPGFAVEFAITVGVIAAAEIVNKHGKTINIIFITMFGMVKDDKDTVVEFVEGVFVLNI